MIACIQKVISSAQGIVTSFENQVQNETPREWTSEGWLCERLLVSVKLNLMMISFGDYPAHITLKDHFLIFSVWQKIWPF